MTMYEMILVSGERVMINLASIQMVSEFEDNVAITLHSGDVVTVDPASFKMAIVHSEAKYFKMGEEEAPKEVEGELI